MYVRIIFYQFENFSTLKSHCCVIYLYPIRLKTRFVHKGTMKVTFEMYIC